jgi:hypothetical protein
MATKAQLEEQVRQLERNQRGENMVTLDGIGPSGVEQLHAMTGDNLTGGGVKRAARKRKPPAKPKKLTVAQRIADLEARVDELEAYEARDEFGQQIYPPNANHAWADSGEAFERARKAWALRNGKELRRRQVAQGQPPR